MADNNHEVPGMAAAIEGRRRQLKLRVGEFVEAAGLTGPGLDPVRKGYQRRYSERTTDGVATALRWPLDWYDRLVAGEDWHDFPDTDHTAPGDSPPPWEELLAGQREVTAALERLAQVIEARLPSD